MRGLGSGAAAVLVAGLVVGCGSSPAPSETGVLVLVEADEAVRRDAVSLEVVIEGSEVPATRESWRLGTQQVLGSDASLRFPVRLAIEPRRGDASRLFRVTLTARDGSGGKVSGTSVESGFVAGSWKLLRVELTASCASVTCGDGEACRAGRCERAWRDPNELDDLDPQDAGVDAGAEDAAADGSSRDAGPEGGADAGRDAGLEGGTDAGRDAGLDAGSDGGGMDGGMDGGEEPPCPAVTPCTYMGRNGVRVGSGDCMAKVAQAAAGAKHTCALTETGRVYCWGRSKDRRLGFLPSGGDADVPVDRPRRVAALLDAARDIAAGTNHTCAAVAEADGGAYCWGGNNSGQLGIDRFGESYGATPVAFDLPRTVRRVGAGLEFSCAVVEEARDGPKVMCWGRNREGQYGKGYVTNAPILAPSGTLLWNVADLSVGGSHACAVARRPSDASSSVYCWGGNGYGQVDGTPGSNTAVPREVSIGGATGAWQGVAAGTNHSCAWTDAGFVYCWGRNGDWLGGGSGTSPRRVVGISGVTDVAAGERHTCAVTSDGRLYCWGSNGSGQLGSVGGDTAMPRRVGTCAHWQQVSAGPAHTCAVTSGGLLYCWGLNDWGQLGLGDTADRSKPHQVPMPPP